MSLRKKLIAILLEESELPGYNNPNFIAELTQVIENYDTSKEIQDSDYEKIYDWAGEMFSM